MSSTCCSLSTNQTLSSLHMIFDQHHKMAAEEWEDKNKFIKEIHNFSGIWKWFLKGELLYQGRDQCLDINDLPEPSYFPTTFCFIFANERINNYRQEVVILFYVPLRYDAHGRRYVAIWRRFDVRKQAIANFLKFPVKELVNFCLSCEGALRKSLLI